MPMKTARRRSTKREMCDLCDKAAHPHHHFDIDLHDGLPHIRIRACGKDHLEWMRIGHRKHEVQGGG